MKLFKKASYAIAEEIALTDSELETVFGGQGWDCTPPPPCSGGAPSYSYGSSYAPSYGSSYAPSYGSSYAPSYGSSYGHNYSSPFATGSCSGSGSTPSYSTITYSVTMSANSSPCNGGY